MNSKPRRGRAPGKQCSAYQGTGDLARKWSIAVYGSFRPGAVHVMRNLTALLRAARSEPEKTATKWDAVSYLFSRYPVTVKRCLLSLLNAIHERDGAVFRDIAALIEKTAPNEDVRPEVDPGAYAIFAQARQDHREGNSKVYTTPELAEVLKKYGAPPASKRTLKRLADAAGMKTRQRCME